MQGPVTPERPREVVAETAMQLVSAPGGLLVTAQLQYTSRDPYAVSVVFATRGCDPVVWVFARDLLLTGVARSTGDGDVRIFPAGDTIVLDLMSPGGSARLVASGADLHAFVDEMLAVVPLGHESSYVDIDLELATLRREALAEWGEG